MPITDRRTVLKDCSGKEHKYYTTLLEAEVGFDLLGDLQETLINLFGHGIGALKDRLHFMESEIDSDRLVQSFMPAIRLMSKDKEFRRQLFSTTTRDGIRLDSQGVNAAYQANYGEYYGACVWLIMENFMRPLAGYLNLTFGKESIRALSEHFKGFFNATGLGGMSGD